MAANQQELVAKLVADVSAFKRGMNEAENKVKSTSNKLSNSFAKVGTALKLGLAAGVIALGVDAFNTIKNFEQGLANLSAVTGQTKSELDGLKNSALQLGASTAYTAGEVTGLQTELAKLGFREKDILQLTKPILNLAQATGTDLANAAALAGSVVQSFGLRASDTTQVIDIMTKSFSASALDIGKFEVGIRQVAPVAKTAGVSLSEVTSILGVLANNGVRAETAGVGLRNILLDSAKKGVPFKDLLEQVNSASDKAAKSMELFGKENAAVGVIVAENIAKIGDLNTELLASAGTAQEMADKQLDTLQGRITLLTSAWDGFVLSLDSGSGMISHVFKKAIEATTWVVNAMSGSVEDATLSLSDMRNEFNKQMTVLQSHNLSQEAKKKVLDNINTEYKEYLPNLITEKTSLTELNKISNKVNDTFQKRIMLQAQEASLIEKITQVTNDKATVIENEIRLEEIRLEKITANGVELAKLNDEEIGRAALLAISNGRLTESESALDKLLAIQKRVREDLNLLMPLQEDENEIVQNATNAITNYTGAVNALNSANTGLVQSNTAVNNSLKPIGGQVDMAGQAVDRFNQEQAQLAQSSQMIAMGLQSAFSSMGTAIVDSLGLAETGLEGFLKIALKTALEVVSMALAQSMAQGIANATTSATSTGPGAVFAQPAFIATSLAGIGAAFSSIPKFAEGGIVGGNSPVGDKLYARLNSDEMVLNGGQQSNLFRMLDTGNTGGVTGERLVTKLQGEDILVAIERAGNKRNRKRGF